jgi:hypothetical protein
VALLLAPTLANKKASAEDISRCLYNDEHFHIQSGPRVVATDVVMLRHLGGQNRDSSMPRTLYMLVEHFKNKDAVAVYRRFRDSGRLAPEGLLYVCSWIDDKLELCYQLMETHDRALLDEWMANWSDLVDFEVHPVITSKEAAERIAPCL